MRSGGLAGAAAMVVAPVFFMTTSVPAAVGQSTFRTATDLVRVYATVKDRDGHLITDLRQGEFELRDRGEHTSLAVFSNDVQRITVAVLVDMSGAVFELQTFELLRRGLAAFMDRLGPMDRARVGWFTRDEVSLGPELTSDREALAAAVIAEIRPERANPRFQYANTSMLTVSRGGRPLWNAIGSAIQSMAKESGRKVVLVLTNGPDTLKLSGLPGLKEIKAAIPTDEYMIYAVNGFEPRFANGIRGNPYDADLVVDAQNTLEALTESTGGGFLHAPYDSRKRGFGMTGDRANEHPLSPAFASMLAGIADELHHQYMLGFVPIRRDGKIGKIEVRVDRADTKVWARKSYLAPKQ